MSSKQFYHLTKPGIVRGNAITATAGFALASQGRINLWLFISMLTGLSLIIASACVFNNFIDRDIDKKMQRTSNRALAAGLIHPGYALAYGILLGLLGAVILALYTNALTLYVALAGLFAYVILYGYGKRRTVHGTAIGSISGAAPPVVGYTSVSGQLDPAALILFMMLVLWQMPHFFAIAIYRLKDYQAAKIPVLPVEKGLARTKATMQIYIVAFVAVALLLSVFGYTGYTYFLLVAALGLGWLWTGWQGFSATNSVAWARRMFHFSLIVIIVLCTAVMFNAWLP